MREIRVNGIILYNNKFNQNLLLTFWNTIYLQLESILTITNNYTKSKKAFIS